jgi:inhibitor of cysteine peptidase
MDGGILRVCRASVVDARAALFAGLLLVLLAASLAACAGKGDTDKDEATVFTEADSGRTFTAAVGDVLEIRVVENPSTGYKWTLTPSAGLERRADDFVAPSTSPQMVGAPGTRVVTFAATASGRPQVIGVYARPWEMGPGPDHPDLESTIAVG